MDYQPACFQCRVDAGKDIAGVKESSLCVPHLHARNAELEAEVADIRDTENKLAVKLAESVSECEALEAKLAALVEALLLEREECAKIAEKYEPDEKLDYVTYASKEIRLRGDKLNSALAAAKVTP